MPSFYSDSETPLANSNGDLSSSSSNSFAVNSSIWSNGTDHQEQTIQNFRQLQPNISASAMQQLAYELSLFSLNQHQQQRRFLNDNAGSAIDYELLEQHLKTGADMIPISASAATALLAAAAAAAAAASGMDSDDGENQLALLARRRSQNTTECVPVPSSEHVAEIVGRQGCKIKALRAKTNTYIKTPVRGEEPVFVVTGRRDDVEAAKREILSAADHFTQIRASRRHSQGGIPAPGHVTAYVRVPYKVVGLVVGPKGATIKRIQQQTHTYIITPSRERDPVFEVTGLPDNVETARKEIETHIANRTGVYPSTTVGTPPSQSFDDDNHQGSDFHLNGVDTTLTNSATATPDSMPINGSSIFSLDGRRDSISSVGQPLSAPPYFSSSLSAGFNPFSALLGNLEQRRASADAHFSSSGDTTASSLNNQQLSAWYAFMGGGASNKHEGLPIFASNTNTANNSKTTAIGARLNLANSHSGSDQDEGVWSVGGESPNSLTVEPLASTCLGSIWSEVVGV